MAKGSIIETPDLTILANGFPPTLNTFTKQTELKPDETPDGYGFDLTVKGLKQGSCPTGTSQSLRTVTLSNTSYYYLYNRAMRTSAQTIIYGALDYDDVYVPCKDGAMRFDDDSSNVVSFIPLYQDRLLVTKSDGGYIVSNMVDSRTLFLISSKVPQLACSNASYMISVGGVGYVTNSYGLIGTDGQGFKELSTPIRNNLSYVQNAALTADFGKQWVIMGTQMVYDAVTERFYRYSGTSFLYTSPKYHLPSYQPFVAERLIFVYEISGDDDGYLTYSIKYDDEDYGQDFNVIFKNDEGQAESLHEDLQNPRRARAMQIKITAISANLTIKEIRHDQSINQYDDYAGKD